MKSIYNILSCFLAAILNAMICYSFYIDIKGYYNPSVNDLSTIQLVELEDKLNKLYPERNNILSSLPYEINTPDLDINAESAILIDTYTGNILFEKNAETPIPPASMTKLVEMYVVFEAVNNGEVNLDDEVPLPPQSWAINLPRDASIMFLAQGQHVTLRELLLGLAIASGNDASIAVANYVCGDMDTFVERMNNVIKDLGLKNTHFVESSGYSEENITTAKDFATFCRVYVNKYPEAITDYHSQKILKYPLQKNLPDSQKSQGDNQAVIQYNTNKMLGKLEGCDGLKTGFIYESGYNIALTATRNNIRLLSVTMKGPGKGSVEGNKYRTQDGTTLMEYGFSNFADYHQRNNEHSFVIGSIGTKESGFKLIPNKDESFCVPYIMGDSPLESAQNIKAKVYIPDYIYGPIECGTQYGTITFCLGDNVLQILPLVADRSLEQDSGLKSLKADIIYWILKTLNR